ncbi:MAG: serine O-acetyltransferase [Chloroflexota bacterium]
MFARIREDIHNVFTNDPAARSWLEVLTCYPGLHALWGHRVAHFCWQHRMRLLGRFISHLNRFFTGIEIHPGATIGRRFFIDHGAGVVIGETTEIGDDVLMYRGAVLGGTSLAKKKRHPTVGNRVVLGTGAIVLGAVTIGDDARIGSGSVVIRSVPPGRTVVGVPGRIVEERRHEVTPLEHARLPDPVAKAISLALKEQEKLDVRLKNLESASGIKTPEDRQHRLRRQELAMEFRQGEGI